MSNSYAPIRAKEGQAWMMRDHIVGSATVTLATSEAPEPMTNNVHGNTPPLQPLRASLSKVMEAASWVGPGRGADIAASPFPGPARRTRRAPHSATGSPHDPASQTAGAADAQGVGILVPR